MKFTLNSDEFSEFSKHIGLTTKVTGAKSPLIRVDLDSVGLHVSGVGAIGKLRLDLPISGNKFEYGSVIIKEDFIRVLKAIPISKNDSVIFSLGKNNSMSVRLSTGNSKYTVRCLSPEMVPPIDFGECNHAGVIDKQDLFNGLNTKLFCKTDAETANFFGSVKVSFSKDGLSFVGSDVSVVMHVLFKRSFDSSFDLLIPHTVASVIQGLLGSDCSDLKLGVTSTGHGLLKSNIFNFLFSTTTTKYPDISGLLVLKSQEEVIVNNQQLLEKLLIINSLSNVKIANIIVDGDMVIKNTDTDIIQVDEVLHCKTNGKYNIMVMIKPLIIYLNQMKSHSSEVRLIVDKFISVRAIIDDVMYTIVTTPVVK